MDRHLSAAGATVDFKQPREDELPDTFPRGRGCGHAGCITVLSIYNGGVKCHAHTRPVRDDESIERLMSQAA